MTYIHPDAVVNDRVDHGLVLSHRLGDNCSATLLTLNRPDQLNALDRAAVASLTQTLTEVSADPSVRCVLITGAGRAFCTGGDLKGFTQFRTEADVFTSFVNSSSPS